MTNPEVKIRLPDKHDEIKRFPKKYLCDVIYTILKDDFKVWVKEHITERNLKIATDGNLNIAMDPEIA